VNGCGTYAGYQTHIRRGTPTCRPCKDAAAVYRAEWLAKNPVGRALNRAQRRAYIAAEARLREMHREEFDRIYAEERSKQGLGLSERGAA
jgi:hypothetical protein